MDDGEALKPVAGLWKVVDAQDVEYLSTQGWELAKVVVDSQVETVSESVPFLIPGQTYTTSGCGTRTHTVQKSRYLMFKNEKSALALMAVEAKKQHVELRETEGKLREQEHALKELFKAHSKLLESEKQSKVIAENCTEKARQDRVMIHKMEQDIAKIRTAIGGLKMKEILEQ